METCQKAAWKSGVRSVLGDSERTGNGQEEEHGCTVKVAVVGEGHAVRCADARRHHVEGNHDTGDDCEYGANEAEPVASSSEIFFHFVHRSK